MNSFFHRILKPRASARVWFLKAALVPGSRRHLQPFRRDFGFCGGNPIDRFYIERFLDQHQGDIRGTVLEIGSDIYTKQFGGNRVVRSEVLHVENRFPKVTIVADLASGEQLKSDSFDCVILTQTLQFIFDVASAIRTVHRILRPGGVVLATLPCVSQISRSEMERWGDYWRFTSRSAARLFGQSFSAEDVTVEAHGNAFVAGAFLYGFVVEELTREELCHLDDDYQVLVTVRAVKAPGPSATC